MPHAEGKAAGAILSVPRTLRENPYQLLLYRHLAERGATILDADPRAAVIRHCASFGVLHVHWLWLNKDPARNLLRARRYRALLDEAARAGWPIVWTAHNAFPHEHRAAERRLHERLARSASGVIAHTEAARREVVEAWGLRAPVAVIPHGHYREAYPPAPERGDARRRLGLGDSRPVILAFGQVRPYKGFEALVERFHASSIEARLVVAGRPSGARIAADLRRAAAGDPRIRLELRFVPDSEVPLFFGAADWVALPFMRVTTSGSAILALSFDRPLVLPDVPALRETCGEGAAEYFRDGSDLIPALGRALVRDAGAASAAARAQADRLAWGPIADATLAFFESVRATPSAAGPR